MSAGITGNLMVALFSVCHVAGVQQLAHTRNEPVKVVSEFIEAVNEKNFAALNAIASEDLIWDQPGDNRIAGKHVGIRNVIALIQLMSDLSETTFNMAIASTAFGFNGNRLAITLHFVAAQPIGAVLNTDNIVVFTIQEHKVTTVTIYSTDVEHENKFWRK